MVLTGADLTVADVEAEAEAAEADDAASDRILAEGPRADPGKGRAAPLIALSDDESELGSEDESLSDEDVILEAGPALIIKHDGAGPRATAQETR